MSTIDYNPLVRPRDFDDDNGVLAVPPRPVKSPIDRVKWAKARKVVVLYCYQQDDQGQWSDMEEVVVKSNGGDK